MTIWTSEQDNALKQVAAWLKTPKSAQIFRLFGFAGTGKSTLARYLAENVDGFVAFAAFTGKPEFAPQKFLRAGYGRCLFRRHCLSSPLAFQNGVSTARPSA